MQTPVPTLGHVRDRLPLTFLRLNVPPTRNVFRRFGQHAKNEVAELILPMVLGTSILELAHPAVVFSTCRSRLRWVHLTTATQLETCRRPEFMRTHMETRLATVMALCALATVATASEGPIDPSKGCRTNPAVVGQCFSVNGRVSVYNGSPSIRIAPKGTKRLLGVVPSENEIMPSPLKEAIGLDRDAFAEMEVCPMTKSKPGHMQLVCVESARNIASQQR